MKNLFLTLGLSLISFGAFASNLQDPEGVLDEVFGYLGKPNFERDFRCGDKTQLHGAGKVAAITMESIDLTQEIICVNEEKLLRTTLVSTQGIMERMGNDTAALFANAEPNDLALDKEAYEADQKEFLFQALDFLGDDINVTIRSSKLSKTYGPEGNKISAMIVRAYVEINDESVPARLRNLDVTLFFNKDLPAISRMFRIDVGGGKMLMLNSLKGTLEVTALKRGPAPVN